MTDERLHDAAPSPATIIKAALAAGNFVTIGEHGSIAVHLAEPASYKKPTKAQIDAVQAAHDSREVEHAKAAARGHVKRFATHRIDSVFTPAYRQELLIAHAAGDDVSADLKKVRAFTVATNTHRDSLLESTTIPEKWDNPADWPQP